MKNNLPSHFVKISWLFVFISAFSNGNASNSFLFTQSSLVYVGDSIHPSKNLDNKRFGNIETFSDAVVYNVKRYKVTSFHVYFLKMDYSASLENELAQKRINYLLEYLKTQYNHDLSKHYELLFEKDSNLVNKIYPNTRANPVNLPNMIIEYEFKETLYFSDFKTELDSTLNKVYTTPIFFKKGSGKFSTKTMNQLNNALCDLEGKLMNKPKTWKISMIIYIYVDYSNLSISRNRTMKLYKYLIARTNDKLQISLKFKYISEETNPSYLIKNHIGSKRNEVIGAEIGFGNY